MSQAALQLGRLVVLTQWSLGRYGWGRWHLCPANIERAIDAGELDVALCGARPRRGAPVREAALRGGPLPVGSLCPRCIGLGPGAFCGPTPALPAPRGAFEADTDSGSGAIA